MQCAIAGAGEVRVRLFGQPCLLKGPQDDPTLQKIHSLSPAELEPVESAKAAKSFLDKLRALSLPSSLDAYREKELRKLEAQTSYFEALDGARKSKSAAPLLAVSKKYLTDKARKSFDAEARKFGEKAAAEQMLETLNDTVASEPQEEFHRALRQMNIQYVCSFDAEGGDPKDSEGESE